MINSPILIICYNRPTEFFKLFKKIEKLKKRKIFIFQDGKKNQDIEWEKLNFFLNEQKDKSNINIKFSKKNLGCKNGVIFAINWFFKHNPQGIILEDDCLPSSSFFKYYNKLLKKYKNNKNIKVISGYTFMNDYKKSFSYTFTKHIEVWGWATWRNVWKKYDPKMTSWKKKGLEVLKKIFNENNYLINQYKNMFELTFQKKIDTWDHQFVYYIWKTNGLAITPKVNLVHNIGFNIRATHTKIKNNFLQKKSNLIKFPLKHPKKIKEDKIISTKMDKVITEKYLTKLKKNKNYINKILEKFFLN